MLVARRLTVVAFAFAFALVACSSGSPSPSASRTPTTESPASGSTPAPARGFSVDGSTIVAPDGTPFVPVGANMLGPESFWPTATTGLADDARRWGWNTVRLNTCLPRGCDGLGVAWPVNDDLDAIVREFTGAGLVVIIDMHQVAPGDLPDAAELARISDWWTDVATRFKGNPSVWFNLLNEPGHGLPAPAAWRDLHRTLIQAVRGTGAANLIVIDGTQYGQDAGTNDTDRVDAANSAILTYGPELAASATNVVFSVHAYDQFGADGTDTERDGRLGDLLDRIHDEHLAVIIGEAGGPADSTDARSRGAAAAFRVAPPRGVGIIAWHAQPGDDFGLTTPGPFDAIDSYTAPGNLTAEGRDLWDLGAPNRHP